MRSNHRAYALIALAISISSASATTFPIKNARQAINVAKAVCLKHAHLLDTNGRPMNISKIFSSLQWEASSDAGNWEVSTIVTCSQRHLLFVSIPTKGPSPKECSESLYLYAGVSCPGDPQP